MLKYSSLGFDIILRMVLEYRYRNKIEKTNHANGFYSPVAQLAERLTVNQDVVGSSPTGGAS